MAKDLASNKINDELFSYPDYVVVDEAVPVSGTFTSDAFMAGKTLDALEIVGIAGAGIADITAVEYLYAETEGGSYTTVAIPFEASPAEGEDLFRHVPDHKKPVWAKIAVTGGASGAGVFTINLGSVRK